MKKLNYDFKNPELLNLALTQSGADADNNNERLEFLGDRVLGLSVAALLYEIFPDETEGELARRHGALVSSDTLADVAAEYDIGKRVRHGHMTAGRKKHILADAMESVFGAIFLDGGFDAAHAVISEIWAPLARANITPPKDAKTALQELAQHSGAGALPEYEFLESGGPSHSPVFNVRVTALGHSATGSGASKKIATTNAAAELLKAIGDYN
ncbi:MAG: ribonuclease III [Alphaproteobacteria bacterium]|nr:ribonuclease III [Alphaproteobacteria bacterium]MCL2758284.1 ribonuclease III [Alphaproteobacteria bacterium]